MGLAGFDFESLNRQWLAATEQPVNTAERYGVVVNQIGVDGYAWRCIGVYHLAPEENRGRHNVFVDVLDEQGKRVRNANIKWRWADDAPQQTRWLDKPDNEPACDVPIDKGATVSLWVDSGALATESVTGIHTRHPDEGTGNTYGHHSYYVVFAKLRTSTAIITPPVIDPPVTPPTNSAAILAQLGVVEAELAKLRGLLQ